MPLGILDFLRKRTQDIVSTVGRDIGQFSNSFRGPDLIQQANKQVNQSFQQAQPTLQRLGRTAAQTPVLPFAPKQFNFQNISRTLNNTFQSPSNPNEQKYLQAFGNPQRISQLSPQQLQAGRQKLFLDPIAGSLGNGLSVSKRASSVLSFVDKALGKVHIQITPEEFSVLRNETQNIPRGDLANAPQLHLDAITPALSRQSKEISREQFLKLHPQALDTLNKANAVNQAPVDNFIQGLEKDAQESMTNMSPVEHRPIPIEINAQEAQAAEANTLAANKGRGGFRGFGKDLQNNFSDWVNGRNAAEFQKYATFRKWDSIVNPDKKIIDTFHDPADKIGNFLGKLNTIRSTPNSQVRQFFDNAYKKITDAGYKLGYKTDYFPQLWSNPQEEVVQKMGDRTLSINPSFTFESVIKNYEEGIKAGLTPKFTNVAELMGWYDGQVQRAVADQNFFQTLAKTNYLRPASQSPLGWKSLDPDLFPRVKVSFPTTTGSSEYIGTYKAPPELADTINGYLRAPNDKLNAFANVATKLKNFILENGIPGTGVNFHGVNILVRSALAGNDIAKIPGTGLVKGGIQALYYLINPNAAQREIDSNLEKATFAISKGLKLDVEDQIFGKKPGIIGKLFQVPLFQKVIPGLKIKSFNEVYNNLAKSMDADTAAREASKIVNNIYGGINWEQFGRSRQTQALLRSIIFAPDFQESNLGLGKGVVKSVLSPTNPLGSQYRQIARNLLYMYTGANLLNQHTSGKWMWQNDPGHEFDVQIGFTSTGQKRYFRPFGTAADFIRIPVDVAASLAKGDTKTLRSTIANRISAPLGAVTRFALNVDEFGRPIKGAGDTVINSVANVAQTLIPQYGAAATRFLGGQQSGEQSISQALGLPFRYVSGSSTVVEKRVASYLKKQGASGKEIGGILQYYRDHGALNKLYASYNTDVNKGPDFLKSFKKTAQDDKVINLAWGETAQYANSNPQATDDQIIQYAKKRLDYYNKEVDKAYSFPAQYVEDQKSAQNMKNLSPKAQKSLTKRLRKGR